MDLVSIVIPVYNAKPYLDECLSSIVTQTFTNLEIVLVDDGSTDGSGQLCDEWLLKDKRIKVIHKNNEGAAAARNAGLAVAQGNYISFIDDDDWVHPDFLKTLYRFCEEKHCDIAQCGLIKVWSADDIINDQSNTGYKSVKVSGREMVKRLYEPEGWRNVVVWNKIYRKKVFSDLEFPTGKSHEDEFITWKLFWKTEHVMVTEAPLYYYRQRNDSFMGEGFKPGKVIDKTEALEERALFFKTEDKELFALASAKLKRWLNVCIRNIDKFTPNRTDLKSLLQDKRKKLIEKEEQDKRKKKEVEKLVWLENQVKALKKDNIKLRKKNAALKTSLSFRIGRVITFIPRKLRDGICYWQKHGFVNTLNWCCEKMKNLRD